MRIYAMVRIEDEESLRTIFGALSGHAYSSADELRDPASLA
jgi:hypothetical protein